MVTLAEDAALLALAPRAGAMRDAFRRFCGGLDTGARAFAAAGLLFEIALIVLDVARRELFHTSFLWGDEASKMTLSLVAFIGGAAAYRGGQHTSIRILLDFLPLRGRAFMLAMLEWIVIATTILALWASYALIYDNWPNATPILQVSTGWYALPLPISMLLIAFFAAERLVLRMPADIVLAAGIFVAVVVAAFTFIDVTSYFGTRPDLSLGTMIAIFFAAVLIGLPVSFAMLLSTLIYLQTTDAAPFIAVPQNMVDGTGNYILLALPFFIFAGLIMERGSISLRLVRFAMALVGRARGGLLQVIVITIYLVSGISGSKIADVAAVGSVIRGELKRRGYRPEQGAAALAASAAMAETIPPSIAMLVLGSVTPISIGTLFIAGLLPAAVIAACLMLLIWFRARRTDDVGHIAGTSRLAAIPPAILPLAMPVLMVAGIKFGIATPTEVSTFAVLYGLVLAVIVYRAVQWRQIVPLAMECAGTAGMVLFVLASASSFAWTLTAANLPQQLVTLLDEAGRNPYIFLTGSIVMLIVIGTLLEGLPALIILAPLLMPIAAEFGINGVQYATVLILAMGVGAFMPPVGIGFYVSCAVAEARVETSAREMIPYLVVLVLAIMLIAFVPWITLSVPRMLGSPL